ncbi:MAG: 3-dehydroquinate synthase [Gemmatimonadales bacterium]|nr:MAG: 3-dehydroquinate synthase [Gemmatimonadales bacterium]
MARTPLRGPSSARDLARRGRSGEWPTAADRRFRRGRQGPSRSSRAARGPSRARGLTVNPPRDRPDRSEPADGGVRSDGDIREVTVETERAGRYPVRVGRGVLGDLPELVREHVSGGADPAHLAIISDDRVAELYGDRVRGLLDGIAPVTLHTFPHGEQNKNRLQWAALTDSLLERGVGRDGWVIALGGGVTGDLAGFVAATYMRGIPVVQIPTSLVAMIDSAVGGKTGIDLPGGKNLVGAFHPPRFVLVDVELTGTLPRRERAQGLVEALKHGAILDVAYFETLLAEADRLLDGDPRASFRAVLRSVELKARVVSLDEREGGLRQILNFGHTLGHALEASSGYRLPHGSAVAQGMVLEARVGERLGVTRRGTADRIAEGVRRLELEPETGPSDEARVDALMERAARDKKARAGAVRYVLLREVGATRPEEGWSREVEDEVVRQVLRGAEGRRV